MSYTPTNWKAGDTVTSAKLNKMEQGIASGSSVVMPIYTTSDEETFTCNMTFAEITSAITDGKFVVARLMFLNDGSSYFLTISFSDVGTIVYSTTTTVGKLTQSINLFHNSVEEIGNMMLVIPTSTPDPDPDPELGPK